MKKFLVLTAALAALALGACSALPTGTSSPSSQVLTDVDNAEGAFLVAITIYNVESKGKVDPAEQAAEGIIFNYLEDAKTLAESGDSVSAEQKLQLFNKALADFNKVYTGSSLPVPSTAPATTQPLFVE